MAFHRTFGGLCAELSNQAWKIHRHVSADRALARPAGRDPLTSSSAGHRHAHAGRHATARHHQPALSRPQNRRHDRQPQRTHRADALANGAEVVPRKPLTADGIPVVFNLLNDLVSWGTAKDSAARLRQVNLHEVIQMECVGRHSSILEIRNTEMRGQIYIESGAVTHAAVGELAGEPAFLPAALPARRRVPAETLPPAAATNHPHRWESLLMDAARATDEETVMLKKPAAQDPTAEGETTHIAVGDNLMALPAEEPKLKPADGDKK
jgi:hypothetical protein